jgi:hypothetical protein
MLFTAITSLNFMGIASSKPLYRYSKKIEIMPYLFHPTKSQEKWQIRLEK